MKPRLSAAEIRMLQRIRKGKQPRNPRERALCEVLLAHGFVSEQRNDGGNDLPGSEAPQHPAQEHAQKKLKPPLDHLSTGFLPMQRCASWP